MDREVAKGVYNVWSLVTWNLNYVAMVNKEVAALHTVATIHRLNSVMLKLYNIQYSITVCSLKITSFPRYTTVSEIWHTISTVPPDMHTHAVCKSCTHVPSSSKMRTVLSRKTSGIPSCSSVRTSCSVNSSRPSLRSSSISGTTVPTVLESGLKVNISETAS